MRRAPDLRSARVRACHTYEEAVEVTLDEALDTTCRSCTGTTRITASFREHDPQHGYPMLRQVHECLHCDAHYERVHQVPLEDQYRNPLWDALTTGTRLMVGVTVQMRRGAKAIGVLTSAR